MTRTAQNRRRSAAAGRCVSYKVQSYCYDSEQYPVDNKRSCRRYSYNRYGYELSPESSANYYRKGLIGFAADSNSENIRSEGYNTAPKSLALRHGALANIGTYPLQSVVWAFQQAIVPGRGGMGGVARTAPLPSLPFSSPADSVSYDGARDCGGALAFIVSGRYFTHLLG